MASWWWKAAEQQSRSEFETFRTGGVFVQQGDCRSFALTEADSALPLKSWSSCLFVIIAVD
jgi:hypothetical protein